MNENDNNLQSKFNINIESENQDELIEFILESGVSEFETRPFIKEHDGIYSLSNTVSENNWDAIHSLINSERNELAIRFEAGTEDKEKNKHEFDPKDRLKLVSKINRFDDGRLPEILGTDQSKESLYFNIHESSSAISNLAANFKENVRVIDQAFPNKTIELQTFQALHISTDFSQNKPCMMLIAGVHAREWVPQDAMVYFASDLLQSHTKGHDLKYGDFILTYNELQNIFSKIDFVILPCANPDGREYSQLTFPDQRKNMNITDTGKVSKADTYNHVGVDINRNFKTGWKFKKLYENYKGKNGLAKDYSRIGAVSSKGDKTSQSYQGQYEESEKETENIVWLMDEFLNTHWLLDCHGFSNVVLVPWGLEENQTDDPMMHIDNSNYNLKRGGSPQNKYGEYMRPEDSIKLQSMADTIVDSTKKAFNEKFFYSTEASFFGAVFYYPGVLPDYAYSRQFFETLKNGDNKPPILSLTIETGRHRNEYPGSEDGFQPDLDRALILKKELCAGIFGLTSHLTSEL